MSDPSLILKVLQALYSPMQKGLSGLWRRGKIQIFKFRNKKSPLSGAEASQAATSLLGGDVPLAISFRNISTNRTLIAALRRSSERDFDWRVFLLEQLGSTFQIVWRSDMLASLTKCRMEVHDLDDDGNCEVIYEDQRFGTGGGYRSLHVYFPESKQLHSLTESLNWQDLSGPVSPTITIQPEGEKRLRSQIERVASKRGFLQPPTQVDFDKPEFASRRWHKENGKFPRGKIRIHYYGGTPHILSTLVTTVRASDRIWFSFFKGPLVEYDLVNDRHFVVYSPAWYYNWVECALFDGERLWCGIHLMKGLISYEPRTGLLLKHERSERTDLPEVQTIATRSGVLVLNGTLTVRAP